MEHFESASRVLIGLVSKVRRDLMCIGRRQVSTRSVSAQSLVPTIVIPDAPSAVPSPHPLAPFVAEMASSRLVVKSS